MTHIIIATDLSPLSDRAIDRGLRLSTELGARASVLHVMEGSEASYLDTADGLRASIEGAAAARLDQLLEAWPHAARSKARPVVRAGSAWREVLAYATEKTCHLIVVGLHQASIKDVLMGTTVERLVRQSPVPVLLVRDRPAGPYRRALAATNLSPASSRALRAAALVAKRARFSAVNVFETAFPAFMHPDKAAIAEFKRSRIEEVRQQFHRHLTLPRKSRGNAHPEVLVLQDEIVHGIAVAVSRTKPDLLVMGAHDRGGIFGSLLGTAAQAFLSRPPCDVLISR